MIYNLNNIVEAEQAKARLDWLTSHGKRVELKEKRYKRTLSQNSYLHVLIGFYASQTGYTLEETKQGIFKREVNPNIFRYEKKGKEFWGSTADIDTKKMTTAIERFKDHALLDLDIRLPEPHEEQFLAWCQEEIDKHKQYL